MLLVQPVHGYAHGSAIKQHVYLNVPVVAQEKALFCGPATIEMLFRYWGVNSYNQYDIALAMLKQFPDSIRYQKSGIYETYPPEWDKYPGTATMNMVEFLQRYARTDSFMLEHEAASGKEKIHQEQVIFDRVKWYVSNGIPVIVHQYRTLPNSRGHYRIVTGYDEAEKQVYLNDADGGRRIIQTYEKFLQRWNVDGRWLHYYGIAFNVDHRRFYVSL